MANAKCSSGLESNVVLPKFGTSSPGSDFVDNVTIVASIPDYTSTVIYFYKQVQTTFVDPLCGPTFTQNPSIESWMTTDKDTHADKTVLTLNPSGVATQTYDITLKFVFSHFQAVLSTKVYTVKV